MLSSSKIALAFAVALTSSQPVFASGENIIGGILGIGGALIINEIAKGNSKKKPSQKRRQLTEAQIAEIEAKKEVQRRLNTLGFNTGKPDGQFGPKTRRAISAFQASIGFTPTGALSQEETALLYQQSVRDASGVTSFPTLSGQTNQPAETVAKFPTLGGKQVTRDTEPASFPTIADRPDPAIETTKFPALAAPVSLNSKLTEDLAITAPTSENSIENLLGNKKASDFSLDTVLSETKFESPASQPKILGVALGNDVSSSLDIVATAGFSECQNDVEELQWICSKQTTSFIDTIQIDATLAGFVWNISRQIAFNEPLEVSFLQEKFQTAYGDLELGKHCFDAGVELVRSQELMAQLSSMQTLESAEQNFDLAATAINCPVVFDVFIPDTETSGLVEVHFSHIGANVQRWLDHKENMRVSREKKLQDISAELSF